MDHKRFERLLGIVVFILSFLWFYFPGEYAMIANQDLRIFLTTPEYFTSFLDHPGGLLQYIGYFLNQFLRFRLFGALVLSGVVTAGYFSVGQVIARISGERKFLIIGIITPALFLGMHNYYPHQIYHSLGFILATCLAVMVPAGNVNRRFFLALTLPVFYLVCGGFVWFFSVLVLAMDFARNRRINPELILLMLIYPVIITLAGARLLYLHPLNKLFIASLPFGQQYDAGPLPYIFIAWILVFIIMASVPMNWKLLKPAWRFLPETMLSLAGIALILNFSYNRKNAEFFRIEKLAINEDWPGLLMYSAQHPSMNLFGSFYTNLALVNNGMLCSHLFDYPQPFGRRGLCFEWDAKGEILRRGSDFFWSINFVNEAHHWAFESMIVEGFTQRNLKRLIQTELVRGNYKVAEKYIYLLDHTLFDKKLADYYRAFLFNREGIEKDIELGPRIRASIGKDFFTEGRDLEKNLRSLLSNNFTNKPAMDYLMALFLLEKEVDEIANFIPGYLELNDDRIPSLLDESLLVYKITHPKEDLSNIIISQNTVRRFEEYTQVLRQYRDPNQAAQILYPAYKNSFWFYMNFSTTAK